MNFLVILGVCVYINILAQLPLLEFVREVSVWANRFGISLQAHRLPGIFLGNVEIDSAGSKHRVGQVRCPCRKRKNQRKTG